MKEALDALNQVNLIAIRRPNLTQQMSTALKQLALHIRFARSPILFLLLCMSCLVSCQRPVDAQEQFQSRTAIQENGYVVQKGWQAGMVRGCPNLSHFHWEPVTTMIKTSVPIPVMSPTGRQAQQVVFTSTGSANSMDKPASPNICYKSAPCILPRQLAPGSSRASGEKPRGSLLSLRRGINSGVVTRRYISPIPVALPASVRGQGTSSRGSILRSIQTP